MNTHRHLIYQLWAAALLLFLAGAPAQAIEPFALLDDFSDDRINKDIWDGSQRPESDVLDFAREVRDGKLRLMGRSFADAPPPGETRRTTVRLFLNNSGAVTQMAATLRVSAVEISGCTDPIASFPQIAGELFGYFFTDAGPPAPLDATRNVIAGIRVRRRADSIDPPGVMDVAAGVFRCTDPECHTRETLFFDPLGTTITPGEGVALVLVWDPDNDRLIFLRTPPLVGAVFDYAGILTDVDPPSADLRFVHKGVHVLGNIENCMTGPRASGLMDLSVDKIWVNQSAVP